MNNPAMEKLMSRKLRLLVAVQTMLLVLALASQLDALLFRDNNEPTFWVWLIGAVVGLGIGWLVARWLVRYLTRLDLQVTFGCWVGMLLGGLLTGGLFFSQRANVPMDWRPVLSATLLGTLPGFLLGLLFSHWLSRDLTQVAPMIVSDRTLATLSENLAQVINTYPGADGRLYTTSEHNYTAQVQVPRTNEDLVFYVACDQDYPRNPPLGVAVELVTENGRVQKLPYDAPIIYYWNKGYGLKHIIQEALQILVR